MVELKNKANTHIRVHGKEGYILSLDLTEDPTEVINHLIKTYKPVGG